MEILEYIETNFNNLIDTECRETGIGKFKLGNLRDDRFLIVRLERESRNDGTKCDCIIFSFLNENNLFAISIVELKSPSHSFAHAKSQIESCISFLKDQIFNILEHRNILRTLDWDFFPILVSKSFPSRINNKAILSPKNRINFIGNRESRIVIKAKYNNDDLKKVILNNFRKNLEE